MEYTVSPEANPASMSARVSLPSGIVEADCSDQTDSQPRDLTELTGADIFRMKGLRPSDSASASEVADKSAMSVADVAVDEEDFASDQNAVGDPNIENPLFDPDAGRDESTELNEEDIFRMKSLSMSRVRSELTGQSAVSLVDSTSNYEEGIDDGGGDENASPETPASERNQPEMPTMNLAFSGQYVFGRLRVEKPELNKLTVVELDYPFEPLGQPPPYISLDEYLSFFRQSKLYIVGSAHFSVESQNDVRNTILQTQPDAIMIELCAARMSILSMDEETLLREAQNLNRDKIISLIKECGVVQGLLHVLLLCNSAQVTRQLGMAPGGEFRAAHMASYRVPGSKLVLGDRPIQITLQRVLSSLSFFQKLRIFFHMVLANFGTITREEVEGLKEHDALECALKEMTGDHPQFSKIIISERDQYMTYVLQSVMEQNTINKIEAWRHIRDKVPYQPLNVVAVVGIGHLKGMVQNWNRHINKDELLEIPKPTRTSRLVGFVVRVSVIGATVYLTYRTGRFLFNKSSSLLGRALQLKK